MTDLDYDDSIDLIEPKFNLLERDEDPPVCLDMLGNPVGVDVFIFKNL